MAFVQSSRMRPEKTIFSLDPRTKLLFLLLLSFLLFMINDLLFMTCSFGFLFIISLLSRVELRKLLKYIKPTLWLIPTLFIIQLAFSTGMATNTITIYSDFGFLADFLRLKRHFILINKESLIVASNASFRIINLAITSCLFSLTTNSNDYLQSLTKIGVPFELAFTTGLVIYFLPMVVTETTETQMALEARGISVNYGSFISRLKCFRILAAAILVNFIEKSRYQAIALDSRGFNTKRKRTFYRKVRFGLVDALTSIGILAITAGMCYFYRIEIVQFFAGFWLK
ncbi:MAG: hypothetical protein DRP02_11740 [Candidatus Gerdarchaeota archaeon]|nr:MAG: hypothetical protein DRO63_07115 [Candidatus Gerdarchaeota archaeon]RLI68872.1 MAG: hypothetical protein DRP02_11740 [Candidatus Gerdarchaeota archaeon]